VFVPAINDLDASRKARRGCPRRARAWRGGRIARLFTVRSEMRLRSASASSLPGLVVRPVM